MRMTLRQLATKFLFLTVISCPVLMAQSLDVFYGRNDVSCTSPPLRQNATCSRAGTTVTCTVTNGAAYVSTASNTHIPMVIEGTGTALDVVWTNGQSQAGGMLLNNAGISGNTLTMTSATSGAIAPTAGTVRPARWWTELNPGGPGLGYKLCTPQGHWQFTQQVSQAIDWNGFGVTKYGSACINAKQEFLVWNSVMGFNGIGHASDSALYDGGACPTNPRAPFFLEQVYSVHAMDNLTSGTWAGLDQALKNLDFLMTTNYTCSLRRPLMDYFDSRWKQDIIGEASSLNPTMNAYASSAFIIGVTIDDTGSVMLPNANTDFHTAPAGNNDCDGALAVAVTSPHQSYSNHNGIYGSNNPWLYPDDKVYSKTLSAAAPSGCFDPVTAPNTAPCSWPDFVRNKYGTVAAMNADWGATYTSFDSTETKVTGESIGTGNGITTNFSFTFAHANVTPGTIHIKVAGTTIGGDCPQIGKDCGGSVGNGYIIGLPSGILASTTGTAGVLTYSTGVTTGVKFSSAPAVGQAITVDYTFGGWASGGTGLPDETGANTTWVGTNYKCLINPPSWSANTAYPGSSSNPILIINDNTTNSWQALIVPGTSGSIRPNFTAISGSTITDGPTATWESIGNRVCGTGGDFPAANANPNYAATIEAFLGQFAAKYLGDASSAMKGLYPGLMYAGSDENGVWKNQSRSPVLKASVPFVDFIFTEMGPLDFDPQMLAKLRWTTYFWPKGILTYNTFVSPQSEFSVNGNFPQYATRQLEGRAWYNRKQWTLTNLDWNGRISFIGDQWNSYLDGEQGSSFGFEDKRHNPFDGISNVSATLPCSSPNAAFNCGGNTTCALGSGNWCGTDLLTHAGCGFCLIDANALWLANFSQPITIPAVQMSFNVMPLPSQPPVPTLTKLSPANTYLTSQGFSQDGLAFASSLSMTATGSGFTSTTVCTLDGTPLVCTCGSSLACTIVIPATALRVPTAKAVHTIGVSNPAVVAPVVQ